MAQPITSKAKSTEYVSVRIYDEQNGVEKAYKFPAGTIFKTSNTEYHIEKNRIREFHLFEDDEGETLHAYKGDRIDGIPVILPQYIALDVLDVNNDQKIDNYDVKNSNVVNVPEDVDTGGYAPQGDIIASEINDRLKRSNSSFFVGDVGWSGVSVDFDNGSFDVNFIDSRCISKDNPYGWGNNKSLSIFLPQE